MATLAVPSYFNLSTLRGHRCRPSASAFPAAASLRSSGSRCCSSLPPFTCSALSPTSAAAAAAAAAAGDIAEEEAAKFAEACKNGNLVPLYRCIFCDHLTPVLAYRCLVKEDDRDAPSFLFESVEQGSRGTNVGRYSVIGAQPAMEIVAKENLVSIMDHEEGTRTEELVEDPMEIPRRIMEGWSPQCVDELPDAFSGGWVGFFSYDTVRYVEKKKLPFSSAPKDDRNLPDVHLGLYNDIIVFDHVEKKAYVIHWVRLDRYSSVEEAYHDGKKQLEKLLAKVHNIDVPRLSAGSVKLCTHQFGRTLKMSSMTSEAYKEAVLKAKEHIMAGDIFQIVLSQRFERHTFADPFEVYRALRIVNPSPYMTYLQARGCILVSSSPEILTRVKKGKIVNRPLAGTVRRGKTEEEDQMLERQLLNDEKQCAEHIMLVDLGRNDVGKVSKPGSVKVEKLMNVERYSHVMHISSTVTGELFDHLTCWDALRAALPVGTVSGAPTIRQFCSTGFQTLRLVLFIEESNSPCWKSCGTVLFHIYLFSLFIALNPELLTCHFVFACAVGIYSDYFNRIPLCRHCICWFSVECHQIFDIEARSYLGASLVLDCGQYVHNWDEFEPYAELCWLLSDLKAEHDSCGLCDGVANSWQALL